MHTKQMPTETEARYNAAHDKGYEDAIAGLKTKVKDYLGGERTYYNIGYKLGKVARQPK